MNDDDDGITALAITPTKLVAPHGPILYVIDHPNTAVDIWVLFQ